MAGQLTPRSLAEMRFAASLAPCPHCGFTRPAKLDLQGGGNSWVLYGPCPSCGKARSVNFTTDGDPFADASPLGRKHDRRELGGTEPSRIITPKQFIAELERVLPSTHVDPMTLDVAAWMDASKAVDRAVTVARELLKFPGQEQFRDERERLNTLAERFAGDASRIWMLRQGRLTLGEEIRGLLNQVTPTHLPTLAALHAYLERRPSVVRNVRGVLDAVIDADSDVGSIGASAGDGAVTVVLVARRGTRTDIEEAIGRDGATSGTVDVMGHRLDVPVEYDGDAVRLVTIRFA